jgi:hypothetical protein
MPNALEIAISALREIKDTQGRVCNGFELCNHIACHSSYSSWVIADKALKDIEALLTNENTQKDISNKL